MVVAYINHQGGKRSHGTQEEEIILTWVELELHVPALSISHISGMENWQADFITWQWNSGQCTLHSEVFKALCSRIWIFWHPSSTQVCPLDQDPKTFAVDALLTHWIVPPVRSFSLWDLDLVLSVLQPAPFFTYSGYSLVDTWSSCIGITISWCTLQLIFRTYGLKGLN